MNKEVKRLLNVRGRVRTAAKLTKIGFSSQLLGTSLELSGMQKVNSHDFDL